MKKVKKVMSIILAFVFVISLFGAGNHLTNYIRADESYDLAKEIAHTPEFEIPEVEANSQVITSKTEAVAFDTDIPALPILQFTQTINPDETAETEILAEDELEIPVNEFAMELLLTDVAALQKVNPDVIGWICIPGTSISYPLIQGKDNSYYLDYSWEGMKNRVGSIYLDYRSSADFVDFHSIIYGHRMYVDAMFNALRKYDNPEFLEAHPSVYVLINERVLKYDVFSAYNAETEGPSWRLGLSETEGQQALIDFCIRRSVIDAGITPSAEEGDKLLTLSTCSQSGDSRLRWVVHCVQSGIYTADQVSE